MPVVSIFFATSYQNLETTISVQGEGHGTGLRLELSIMSAQHNRGAGDRCEGALAS